MTRQLAQNTIDAVRRRVQTDTLGHRGRSGDPLYGIRAVLAEVDLPVNVLAVPGTPPVAELAELGVRRVSVGASFTFSAYAALADAATELLTTGTYAYTDNAARGRSLARDAFS